jgi:hypothetical protein
MEGRKEVIGKFWNWEILELGNFGIGKFWNWEILELGNWEISF